MAEKTIAELDLLGSVDRSADFLEISDTSDSNSSRKVTVNTLLNISSQPLALTDAQSPTNKTFDNSNIFTIRDDRLTLQDSADTTKQAVFQLSGITTGTTRTYTLPNASSTLVDLTSTQTLSGKTLSSPTINTPTITNPTLTIDTISEFTGANGVTIDGLSIKDSKLNTNNSVVTSNITDSSVTGAKIASYRMSLQTITTNTTETTLYMQTGVSYITGTGANTAEKTITFPVAFSAIKNVIVGATGLIDGSNPTAITSFNAGFSGNNVMLHPYNITTTTMVVRGTLDSSATLASNLRVGFTWIAFGTL